MFLLLPRLCNRIHRLCFYYSLGCGIGFIANALGPAACSGRRSRRRSSRRILAQKQCGSDRVFRNEFFVLADVRVFLRQFASVFFSTCRRCFEGAMLLGTDDDGLRAPHHGENSTRPESHLADVHRWAPQRPSRTSIIVASIGNFINFATAHG